MTSSYTCTPSPHPPSPIAFKEYWQVVTRDATAAAGAAAGCDTAVRSTWAVMDTYGATDAGRATLSEVFKLCTPVKTSADVYNLKLMMLNAWDTMASLEIPRKRTMPLATLCGYHHSLTLRCPSPSQPPLTSNIDEPPPLPPRPNWG